LLVSKISHSVIKVANTFYSEALTNESEPSFFIHQLLQMLQELKQMI